MLNRAEVIGHLGRDPEIRYTQGGDAACTLAIATTERWKDKEGNPKEHTEWHRCTAFGKTAEICGKYLKKGSLVYVAGKLKTKKYTDRDGVEKYSTEIAMHVMQMLDRKPEGQQDARPQAQESASSGFDDMESDIPF